jgi:hypothetical protein
MSALGNLTDHALATIASILDHSDARREPREAEKPESLVPTMADGYTKIGPGPLAAMRLKWTVRRNVNNEYFVDEMIGENLACTVAGPMAKEAAVKFVDDREAEARRQFEQLRSEMMGMPLMGLSFKNCKGPAIADRPEIVRRALNLIRQYLGGLRHPSGRPFRFTILSRY